MWIAFRSLHEAFQAARIGSVHQFDNAFGQWTSNCRYHRHKSLFVFFILLTLASFASIQFIPSIPKSTQLHYHCNDGVAVLKFIPSSLDHCAADNTLDSQNATANLVYKFDVSNRAVYYACNHCRTLWNLFSAQNSCGVASPTTGSGKLSTANGAIRRLDIVPKTIWSKSHPTLRAATTKRSTPAYGS